RNRAYQHVNPTTTMFKRIEDVPAPPDIVARNHAWPEWRSLYLGEIVENRRAVNRLILDRIPGPRAFFGCRRGGEIVATALCVVGFGCAVVECVATRADRLRQG